MNAQLKAERDKDGAKDEGEIRKIEKNIENNEADAKAIESAPTETSKLQGELAILRKRLTLTVSEPRWVPRPGGDNCQGVDEGPERYMAQLKQFGLASFLAGPPRTPKVDSGRGHASWRSTRINQPRKSRRDLRPVKTRPL